MRWLHCLGTAAHYCHECTDPTWRYLQNLNRFGRINSMYRCNLPVYFHSVLFLYSKFKFAVVQMLEYSEFGRFGNATITSTPYNLDGESVLICVLYVSFSSAYAEFIGCAPPRECLLREEHSCREQDHRSAGCLQGTHSSRCGQRSASIDAP